MYEQLNKIINNAYTPYSNYNVACIITDKDNNLYPGVNIENKYAKGMCAESSALANYSVNNKKGNLKDIYLLSQTDEFITPCFLCREYLYENFSTDAKVYSYNKAGELKIYSLSDLTPHGFTMEEK